MTTQRNVHKSMNSPLQVGHDLSQQVLLVLNIDLITYGHPFELSPDREVDDGPQSLRSIILIVRNLQLPKCVPFDPETPASTLLTGLQKRRLTPFPPQNPS